MDTNLLVRMKKIDESYKILKIDKMIDPLIFTRITYIIIANL